MKVNEVLNHEFEKLVDQNEVDTLLESLLFLSQYHERPVSAQSLIEGLPIHNTVMMPKDFIKASKKIGLIAKPVKRKLDELTNFVLPAVVLLNSGKACIIVEMNLQANTITIIRPEYDHAKIELSLEAFKEEYSGNVLIIKAAYNFKNRVTSSISVDDSKRWFYSAMKKNISLFRLVIIAAILINLFVLAVPLFTMNVYDRVLPNNAVDTLWVLAFGVCFVLFFDYILKILRAHFIEQAGQRSDVRISSRIFDQLLNIRLEEKPASTGQFVNRLQSFESVREFFTTATMAALVDLPFIILFLIVIFYIGGPLVYVSLTTVIIAILFSLFMQRPIKKSVEQSSKEDQLKQTTLTEAVSGLEIIKSVRAQNRMRTHWERAVSQTSFYSNKLHFLSQVVSFTVGLISQLSSIAIVAFGVVLASDGTITMGAIIAAMILNGRVVQPVSQIVAMIIRLDRTLLSLKNIDELMKMPVERDNTKAYLSRPELAGDIIFKEVDFSYKDQNFNVLKNINLRIKKGERVAIVGRIGSGKSTLAKLLMNLYEPKKGSILIDDTEIRQIDPVDLRRVVGFVPQEPFLFMGSIKDNITAGEQYVSDEQILKASKLAGVHEFLGKHEAGYDCLVGERGEGLSGGERQAVTLARALISNPELLILDEPTSMMDELSEANFKKRLENIIEDKTLLLITHRPSLLSLVDRLIVVEDGKILADGPKDQIIQSFINKQKGA